MPRSVDVDAIASAVARRLGARRRSSPVAASLSSRSSMSRLASAVADRLSTRRRPVSPVVASLSSRRAVSSLASAVARRLNVRRPVSPAAASLSRRSSVSRRSVSRIASVVANQLATEGAVRQRARLSMDAVASAVTRRLRYSDQTGTFPVAAVASAVARRLHARRDRHSTLALASSIATRLSRGGREGGGSLPINQEVDPNASGGTSAT